MYFMQSELSDEKINFIVLENEMSEAEERGESSSLMDKQKTRANGCTLIVHDGIGVSHVMKKPKGVPPSVKCSDSTSYA